MEYLLFILCIVNPLLAIYSYRKGVSDTKTMNNAKEEKKMFKMPKIRIKTKAERMIEKEQAKREQEFFNKMNAINDYRG